jgi:Prealbumin-like fold domain
MNCSGLQNNSSAAWLDCNTNASISGTIYCLSLHESIFDIEVLDDQNSQIQQFEGSEQGTTIPNLQPGTYTVNEIEQPEGIFDNQLADDVTTNVRFSNQEFPDGGLLVNTTAPLLYGICFEYEDEQGNDCSTVTLAAGEERTCIVKNYIRGGGPVT